ncbi:NAD(P)-binding protein [Nocardioides sp. LMS-CY]|uniref:FAD-containing monooxygenase EthA n=1 Tax=Nocardioides soli TaxID=1036020 RepID=A0A7W4W1K1_9ACTN|nr:MULTISPECIES: NAD(P)/FAD-dependent oxidoreductase [Nocardioides]MBB3045433.1 cation diffusion facilitator CzcD-associated flavoprotein CzcO [Nocardioides soli]QWF22041.1 NAD(P)-binding protein [Nocardioides sp. LMS-CY]
MTEHVDVLIVGAGLSGIGAACRLRTEHPGRSVAVLEARAASGGTWDLFRYPGVRSDSDMFTFGYRWRPWVGERALADGPSILRYLRTVAEEYGVDRLIRYRHRVIAAGWDSATARWTVEIDRDGEPVTMTASFLWGCGGYYDYDRGFAPDFPGLADFRGTVVHPQHWPDDLDYAGKRVVVIGSGATAVTLVPAMAEAGAGHVTMLQRSPTYVLSLPGDDPLATRLRRLPTKVSYPIVRWKAILVATAFFQLARRRPDRVKAFIRKQAAGQLPPEVDVDTHFKPAYNPWDQRLCFVPDGDLFRALRSGRASVVTDHVDTFTETGIRLRSGEELEADVVVSATGLTLKAMGGVELTVDGTPVKMHDTLTYRALMLSDVPNFAFTIGYTNASWTLKADLVADFVCRLLRHMDDHGVRRVVAPRDPTVGEERLIDFSSGYILRALDELPQQGDREPWKLRQNYLRDVRAINHRPLDDGVLAFS